MTVLCNDPAAFADEALEGFVAAHAGRVRRVRGGVVRSAATPRGQVALVVGGGSGHYPAFAGWVGPGLAHGAACGNLFASPSAAQVASVARASEAGGGVILSFGNYAGDVLHFGQAAVRLRAEGLDVRVLAVTDDIASAPPESHGLRRGTAGDLVAFKVMGAAAERGLGIDEVERLGRRAVAATRSLGVAFGGCTLPGAAGPLFTVAPGRMALGLGIHGEPGIEERELASADAVADLLVDRLLAERPPWHVGYGEDRVAVLVNGLGETKYDELFLVHRRVAARLAAHGLRAVDPEVGELVTSMDMAGLSLTLAFLDDELAELWQAPADSPAYRKGIVEPRRDRTDDLETYAAPSPVAAGTEPSRSAATRLVAALGAIREAVAGAEERLGRLDAVAGDGDHGIGMRRGAESAATAGAEAAAAGAGAMTTLVLAGEAWSERAGGTSGALWGAMLTAFGAALGDEAAPGREQLAAGARAAVAAVTDLGGAAPGDKTLVDAAVPFAETLTRALAEGERLAAAWESAASAATRAAEATAAVPARIGRARVHGERGIGTPDPGAVSFALIVTALTEEF
ncbi:dihydroxyacetone kinase family protein [Streptomyces hainanensis]|uniref:Dihydroxyacetone kinase family protein n=1 Tax=Streptomyces hainanensis TaxID=402648 RepID=A0A4R4TV58_9ACTN|nr:dihydroxyacetone kinase family protein [Streptomyces hainanensis]TDC79083.1 dihydroxyacetone kinase family protein [Streptomyces hainanensis]